MGSEMCIRDSSEGGSVRAHRLAKLEELVSKLRKSSQVALEDYLENDDLQAAVERRLQLAAQICIDIANHLISRLRLRIPDDETNLFVILAGSGVISKDLGERMKGLIRFRNILVHNYLEVDPEIVYNNLRRNISDFTEFAEQIGRFVEGEAGEG